MSAAFIAAVAAVVAAWQAVSARQQVAEARRQVDAADRAALAAEKQSDILSRQTEEAIRDKKMLLNVQQAATVRQMKQSFGEWLQHAERFLQRRGLATEANVEFTYNYLNSRASLRDSLLDVTLLGDASAEDWVVRISELEQRLHNLLALLAEKGAESAEWREVESAAEEDIQKADKLMSRLEREIWNWLKAKVDAGN